MGTLSTRVRALFPVSGKPYELFDSAVLLLAMGAVGYLWREPSAITQESLAPLQFISSDALGCIMAIAAMFAIVCSYFEDRHQIINGGYTAAIFMAVLMSANFFVGWVITDVGPAPLLSSIIYGWVARNLIRNMLERKWHDGYPR